MIFSPQSGEFAENKYQGLSQRSPRSARVMQNFSDSDAENESDAARRYFLSLGAGTHQVPLIDAARRLGFPVVAVDRNLKAPGFDAAAIQLQCSTFRPRRILEMLGENMTPVPSAGVGCRSFGRAGMTAAILSHALGTPGNDLKVLRRFQNKRRLKALLAAHGVPMPVAYAFATLDERDALRKARGPLLVRPAIGHGKLGLRLLETEIDRKRFLQIHLRDNGRLLIEAIVPGQEVTVLGVVQDGRYAPVCLSDKIVSPAPPLFIELGHDFPASVSGTERARIDLIMQTIVTATGLRCGPIVAEFILSADAPETNREDAQATAPRDRTPLLVECAPEIGGEYLADVLLPAAVGRVPDENGANPLHDLYHDYFEELVRLYTGGVFRTQKFFETLAHPTRQVVIRFVPQQAGVIQSLALPAALEGHHGFLFERLLKQPGQRTEISGGNLDRLAVFALSAEYSTEREHILKSEADDFVRAIQAQVIYANSEHE